MPRLLAGLVVAISLLAGTPPAPAQPASPANGADVQPAVQDLQEAERDHLWRVGVWGGVNALGGLALVLGTSRARRSARWHFGGMTAGWGAVNVGIATVGLWASSPPAPNPAAVLAAERQFHDILLFNLGLNVAYSAVGGTMLAAGYRDVAAAGRWRGFGTSLILQGAGLLVLDGIAFFASRARLADLLDPTSALSLQPLPTGLALTVSL